MNNHENEEKRKQESRMQWWAEARGTWLWPKVTPWKVGG